MGTASDLRALLRARTRRAHERLDAAPEQRALLRPGLTVRSYTDILLRHATAYARCESRLEQVATYRPPELRPYRPRLPALRQDLVALAPDRPPIRVEVASETRPIDADTGEGRYLGLRYVLDGATQGARGIAPRVAELLPELGEGRFAFWRVQLDEAPTWPELAKALAARRADGPLARAATEAACEAFAAFLAAFDVPLDMAFDAAYDVAFDAPGDEGRTERVVADQEEART